MAVDTFCFGMFLFELVTGKPPSWRPSGSSETIREILLDASGPGEWVDKLTIEDSRWSDSLFVVGKDCTKELRRRRPLMSKVLSDLEQFYKSLEIQEFQDANNREVTTK